jgi:plasmid stabilization system protein ParE
VKLIVSDVALADLERLRRFLAGKSANAEQRAVSDLIRAIDSLTLLPDRGRPVGAAGLRELHVPFGQSGYIVRFSHDAARAEIVVVRVWHDRELRE